MTFDDYRLPQRANAMLVSVVCDSMPGHQTEEMSKTSLNELEQLCETLGLRVRGTAVQKRKSLDAASILGSGKIEEIAKDAAKKNCDLLVFDFDLTAGQVKRIKSLAKIDAIDRCNVILEIFARHARTKEAKLQVEISRLQYLLPRLTSFWTHFSKQRGGIGLKGEGEQQLELDRRLIRSRIASLKKDLESMNISRKQRAKKRQKKTVTAALVGYTNAGKSSLMNRLCQVDVLEEDKLFATLDSTFRTLNPDTKPPMILIDTVGFLNNLPNTLINGFKTTLESALEADLLIVVSDISHPKYQEQLNVTFDVLKELGLDEKELCIVFNKKDQVHDNLKLKLAKKAYPNSFVVSSFDEDDVQSLREWIIDYFLDKQSTYDVFVPYQKGEVHSKVLGNANIVKRSHHKRGTFYRIRIPDFLFESLKLAPFILSEKDFEHESTNS